MDFKDPSEHKEQVAVVNRLRREGHFVFAVPNGFQADPGIKAKFKREGLTPGIPDLIVITKNKELLFLEMKDRNQGTLSKSQKEIIPQLEALGQTVLVGHGAKDAFAKLSEYL